MTSVSNKLHLPLSPAEFPDSPLSRMTRQPLMLGLFLPIQTGGFSQSLYPRGTQWNFEYSRNLALQAERAGFDFLFGLQQWVHKGGFGGEMKYRENFLDPFITTVALAPLLKRMVTISTVHVLYGNWHPLHLARFAAAADHISNGRFGLNIVTGYDERESQMFGMKRPDHELRYQRADEFSAIMEDLWAGEENLSYAGRWYNLEEAYISPRSMYGRPIMVSASASNTGFQFAAKHSDIVFTSSRSGSHYDKAMTSIPLITAEIRSEFEKVGRQGKTIIFPMIICKPTHAEAVEYANEIVSRPDRESILNFADHRARADAQSWVEHLPADWILGGHVQIIGSPEEVADRLEGLHRAGIDGVQIGFYDFEPELRQFIELVLPILERRGLRIPLSDQCAV
jgi:FMNH2-dependent dimethyl sulfone monooxygenase